MGPLDHCYVLDEDGEPIVADLATWAAWFGAADRVVLQTRIDRRGVTERPLARRRGGVYVSTVFLGLDHNYSGGGPPVLWETMIFGGVLNEAQWRYRSKLEALRGHQAAVDLVIAVGVRAPRRLKKAVRKQWRPRRPGERRRVERFEARVDALERRFLGAGVGG